MALAAAERRRRYLARLRERGEYEAKVLRPARERERARRATLNAEERADETRQAVLRKQRACAQGGRDTELDADDARPP